MGSLTLALALVLFGAALVYAGWTGRSLRDLLTGKTKKPAKGSTG